MQGGSISRAAGIETCNPWFEQILHTREFFALNWAICDKFKDYLYGQSFVVLTDKNPITYVLTTTKLDTTGHCWLAALAAFGFWNQKQTIKHNADALSRLTISMESVKAICNGAASEAYMENLPLSLNVVIEDLGSEGCWCWQLYWLGQSTIFVTWLSSYWRILNPQGRI